MDKLQKWLHEELIDEPFRKIALIEQAKTSAEQKVANLVQQLNDKNAEVISLHEQVKGLEDKVPKEVREHIVEEESPFDSKYQATPEEPESSEQKEWLNMIKELAQHHEMRDTGVEEDAEPEPESEEQQNSWGSKVAKKFGLF
jgi:cell division protein FtsX